MGEDRVEKSSVWKRRAKGLSVESRLLEEEEDGERSGVEDVISVIV